MRLTLQSARRRVPAREAGKAVQDPAEARDKRPRRYSAAFPGRHMGARKPYEPRTDERTHAHKIRSTK